MEGAAPVIVLVLIVLYVLPSIIALCRGKENGTAGVVLVNIFLGWSLVGWVLAFVWAFTGRTQVQAKLEEKRHQEMLAMVASRKD
jgi:hypothetical protein